MSGRSEGAAPPPEAIVHFSGGSDSALCAALLAETHSRVHLLSYDRLSFIGAVAYTRHNHDRLCKVYGPQKFVRRVVPVGGLHKRLCYHDYLRIAARHKLAVTALSFSKLAMHWFSATYALRHGIRLVTDGAVPYMDLYPDQNEKIALRALRGFYGAFGIEYRNPVHAIHDQVEQMLHDRGVTLHPVVRGTADDKQVFYLEQVILALFLKYYVTTHGKSGYEDVMSRLYADRLEYMTAEIRRWQADPAASFLGPLVERVSGGPAAPAAEAGLA